MPFILLLAPLSLIKAFFIFVNHCFTFQIFKLTDVLIINVLQIFIIISATSSERRLRACAEWTDSDSYLGCRKSHPGIFSPLIHSVVSNDSFSRQWWPWSDCADAQADQDLRWRHMSDDARLTLSTLQTNSIDPAEMARNHLLSRNKGMKHSWKKSRLSWESNPVCPDKNPML